MNIPEFLNLGNVADIASMIGLVTTLYVATQTRALKNKLFKKVRLKEAVPELRIEVEEYMASLGEWSQTGINTDSISKFNCVRSRLLSIKEKISATELKEVNSLLDLMWTKKFFVMQRKVADIPIDECWEIASKMNGVVVTLDQKIKDLNWSNDNV